MSKNNFTIFSTWDPEADSAAVHAERVRESLTEFGVISPALRSWSIIDRATLNGVPLDKAQAQFDAIVARGLVAMNDLEPSPSYASFSVVGAGRRSFRGACCTLFKTEFDGPPDPSVVCYPVFKSIMTALAPIWNVTYANAYPKAIMEYWDEPRHRFDLTWMTYLSALLASEITLPTDVHVEKIDGGGVVLSAAEEIFDVTNPQHMAAARSIREALKPLNKLFDPPWEKSV